QIRRRRRRKSVKQTDCRAEILIEERHEKRIRKSAEVRRAVRIQAQIARKRMIEEVLVRELVERRRDDEHRRHRPARTRAAPPRPGARTARRRAHDRARERAEEKRRRPPPHALAYSTRRQRAPTVPVFAWFRGVSLAVRGARARLRLRSRSRSARHARRA